MSERTKDGQGRRTGAGRWLGVARLACLAWALGLAAACSQAVAAPRVPTAAELLNWAEAQYGSFFPGPQADRFAEGYVFRFYPQTGNYLGVAGQGIYVLGPLAGSTTTPAYLGELAAFACNVHPTSCAPGAYPTQPITLVVPYAPGSVTDTLGRWLAAELSSALGQTVSVQIRAGAAGQLGAVAVQNAVADGYTLLLHDHAMATTTSLFRVSSLDPLGRFETVGLVAESALSLVGRPGVPPTGTGELVTWMRSQSGRVNVATAGTGSISSLCALALRSAAGTPDFVVVPYRGTAPAMSDLLAGQTDLYCETLAVTGPQIEAGRVKPFGVTTADRSPIAAFAGLPTLSEGGLPGFYVSQWHGVYAPKGTPAAVLERLNAAVRAALGAATATARLEALGMRKVPDAFGSPAVHRDFLAAQIGFWGPLIRSSGEFLD